MSLSSSLHNDPLLELLRKSGGNPVSGVGIGQRLGMTKAGVWKRIQMLRGLGFRVESVPRRGYILREEPDLLTRDAVGFLLQGKIFLPDRYHFFESLESTNEYASKLAASGALEGTVVVADRQTRGRGRLGRVWESPAGINLYFSMVLRPMVEPRHTAQLTLISGLALAETVSFYGAMEVEIKWPNDLLLGKSKLAGILTEMASEENRVRYVIVGVGLNVNGEAEAYSPEVRSVAISLRGHLKKTIKRGAVLADFMLRFERWYGVYMENGFTPIRLAWMDRSGIRGKHVQVNLMRESFSGLAEDMDSEGFLMVRRDLDGTLERVMAGDVTPL